jgi:hypothetical protein
MAVAAVEALAARLDAGGMTLQLRARDRTGTEYAASLDDGSTLFLQIAGDDEPFARLRLFPKGMVNGVLDLCRLGDLVRPGLFGRSYLDPAPIHVSEMPTMTAFLDRVREACLGADPEIIIVTPAQTPPAMR